MVAHILHNTMAGDNFDVNREFHRKSAIMNNNGKFQIPDACKTLKFYEKVIICQGASPAPPGGRPTKEGGSLPYLPFSTQLRSTRRRMV